MIEKAKKLAGKCPVCGKIHPLVTAEVYVGPDATERLVSFLKEKQLECLVVCDKNTEKYARVIAESAECLVYALPADSHATEITTRMIQDFAKGKNIGIYVACGSGSIHDAVRYVAHAETIPFISYPTAASVDGFVSGVAAMTWYGQKLSFTATPPCALFADDRVYKEAPARLTASGASDILGKYTALADWRAAHILTGEHLCERIYALEKEALDETAYAVLHRDEFDDNAYTKLIMNGLILSGLAMQLQENSRPASGAEHHMSHFWEMHLINPESEGLHGEQVGVALLAVLDVYKKFASRNELLTDTFLHPDVDAVMERTRLEKIYGELTDGILKENMPDGKDSSTLSKIQVANRLEAEKELRAILKALPSVEEAEEMLRRCGAPTTLRELGLPENGDLRIRTAEYAPYVRNRLSLLKLIAAENLSKQK